MNIFEYIEHNENGEELVAKTDKCVKCMRLHQDGFYCAYWKKTLQPVDGENFGMCSGFKEKAGAIGK